MKAKFKNVWNSWLRILVVPVGLMLLGSIVPEMLIEILGHVTPLGGNALWNTAGPYFTFIGIWVAMLWHYKKSGKDHWLMPQRGRGDNMSGLLIGLLIGFAMNAACVLAAKLTGSIALEAKAFSIPAVLLIFACVFVQSSAEELICRHHIYWALMRQYNKPIIAITVNSALFAVMHLFNPGLTVISVVNILLCGVLCSLMVWATDSLWMAFAFHTMWNFTQNIIFGLPNSGVMVPYTMNSLIESKDGFAYSASFGVEGAAFATILYLAACAGFYIYGKKRRSNGYACHAGGDAIAA